MIITFHFDKKGIHLFLISGIPAWDISVSHDEWTSFAFRYDNDWSACHGQQYVRLTGNDVGSYVGVVLCSPTRYKIFLSDNLQETFR